MNGLAAEHIIRRFHYEEERLYLIADSAYEALAEEIGRRHGNTELRRLSARTPEDVKALFRLPKGAAALLLAEPETYLRYRLPAYLDFSRGEPRIRDTASRVLIFPRDSAERMFSASPEEDACGRERLLAEMRDDVWYRITTARGTALRFRARKWLTLDFEICTAPAEESLNGVIVVDGAVFYQKVGEPFELEIRNGKLYAVRPPGDGGEEAAGYTAMTADVMKNPANTQLAEIGIGFCGGARITDCFMEAETAAHTCHFCFGNNVCYGGENESDFHGASVLIRDPVFTVIHD